MSNVSIYMHSILLIGLLASPACSAYAEEANPIEKQAEKQELPVAEAPVNVEPTLETKPAESEAAKDKKQPFYKNKKVWIGAVIVGLCALGVGLVARKWYKHHQMTERYKGDLYLDAKRCIVHAVIDTAESQEQLNNQFRNLRITCHDFRDIIDYDVGVKRHFIARRNILPLRIPTAMDKIKDSLNNGLETAGRAAKAAAPVMMEVAKEPRFWQLVFNIAVMMLR